MKAAHRSAAIACGARPVPFRTRKLSPGTAMVLCPRGHGRVAHRRNHTSPKARRTTFPGPSPYPKQNPGPPTRTPPNRRNMSDPRYSSHEHHAKREEQFQPTISFPFTPLQTRRTAPPDYFLPTYAPSTREQHPLHGSADTPVQQSEIAPCQHIGNSMPNSVKQKPTA